MKRSREEATAEAATAHTPTFPALGEDASIWLPDQNLSLRFGTSLRLMSSCTAFLNESEEFNEVDPSGDWDKWANRVPGAFSLFYAAILDPLQPEGTGRGVQCVLRAVLDNWPNPSAPHNARLIIDYVTTRPAFRGRGHAGRLLQHVRAACAAVAANLYVLALEESCPYWMEKSFVLEQGANLNARLNVFPDVHLLRQASDPPDEGSPDDLALAEEGDDEEEQEEKTASAQQVTSSIAPPVAAGPGGDDDDAELQAALALSMAPTANSSPTGAPSTTDLDQPSLVDVSDVGEAPGRDADAGDADAEERRALEEAIALSLQPEP